MRTCIGCRRRQDPAGMVRIVFDGGRVVLGAGRPGRGAWLCPSEACVAAAEKRRAVGRALRVTTGPTALVEVRSELLESVRYRSGASS